MRIKRNAFRIGHAIILKQPIPDALQVVAFREPVKQRIIREVLLNLVEQRLKMLLREFAKRRKLTNLRRSNLQLLLQSYRSR